MFETTNQYIYIYVYLKPIYIYNQYIYIYFHIWGWVKTYEITIVGGIRIQSPTILGYHSRVLTHNHISHIVILSSEGHPSVPCHHFGGWQGSS